jgi:hypothetical protein
LEAAEFTPQIEILTGMKGVGVFIAIIADIMDTGRFRNSKAFASYLRSAPRASNSDTSVSIRGANKKGGKFSAALLTQPLNHVPDASVKLKRWYGSLTGYKKPVLVRAGLGRRVSAGIFQMLKKGECHYCGDARNHEAKPLKYRRFFQSIKRRELF